MAKKKSGVSANGSAPGASRRSGWTSCWTKWVTRLFMLSVVYVIAKAIDPLRTRFYRFDPEMLHAVARSAVASSPDDMDAMVSHILANLTAEYPQAASGWATPWTATGPVALNTNKREWLFNNAGGAMGAMYIIHASITEYLIIFGTPLGTEGHTGLHTADDYFHILQGEQWVFAPGAFEREVYRPGDMNFLPRFTAKQYKMHEGCFALEYARGWIPLMMPFGLADLVSSTLDVPTLWDTVRITGREMLRNVVMGKI
ncbi:C-8 sterol isomerase [Coniophora puteana RWD-64-598 SS2]|uniref:C-8 sterol isomerase n=1 Tax=Coniophora puteana (strain RWD-64-598) TaxID=741705 RepID=A0A5M3MII9_CONPW|nr:C-8 sterol isomerase [Coniophora puteana RWD-64-598 SS2]EIW78441.1 C-8 sterol isomerase [Coniophora puteana RWD-64-598 SS2]